jgi:small subunit ribosomal protein S21
MKNGEKQSGRSIFKMVEVIIEPGDIFQWKMSEFRRKVKEAGIFDELRRRKYYLKPSARQRDKRGRAKARRIKENQKRKLRYSHDTK